MSNTASCPRCDKDCVRFAKVRAGGVVHHHHECQQHAFQITALCKACDLPLEPPRFNDLLPEEPTHGWVGCEACGALVLVCPLEEAEAEVGLTTADRVPVAT